jgi:hypothetical protein
MTMRGSSALLVSTAVAAVGLGLAFAACTSGTTAICDDAGTCLIGVPPDGSLVSSDGPAPGADGGDGGQEAAPVPEGGSGPGDADAATVPDAADAADGD